MNTSPEPVTNVGTSLAEDGAVVGMTLLAWQFPWVAAMIALVLLAVGLGPGGRPAPSDQARLGQAQAAFHVKQGTPRFT